MTDGNSISYPELPASDDDVESGLEEDSDDSVGSFKDFEDVSPDGMASQSGSNGADGSGTGKGSQSSSAVGNKKPYKHMAALYTNGSKEPSIPSSMKLKGPGDYRVWKEHVRNAAISASLNRWITPNLSVPDKVDEFDDSVADDKLANYIGWKQCDARTKSLILNSCSSTPQRQIVGCVTALEMWERLEQQYEGSGVVLFYQAYVAFFNLKCEDHKDIPSYVLAFRETLKKLQEAMREEDHLPDTFITTQFIVGLSKKYSLWGDRQRANQGTEHTKNLEPTTLEDLILDITDEARLRERESKKEEKSANFGGKPSNKGDKGKKEDKSTTGTQLKKCPGCGNPKPRHTPDKCIESHADLRKAWEKENGKKWVAYKDWQKTKGKSDKKDKKSKGSDTDSSDDEKDKGKSTHYGVSSTKSSNKAGNFSCAAFLPNNLMSGGESFQPIVISRDRWNYDKGADDHITNDLRHFTNGSMRKYKGQHYNTVNGPVTPQAVGTVELEVVTTDGRMKSLQLRDVVYIPSSPVNLFSGKKLMRQGGFALPGKLIEDEESMEELCALDDNLFLAESRFDNTDALHAFLGKVEESKTLWHRRMGHLGLDNLDKTRKLVDDMDWPQTSVKEAEELCEPCELGDPKRKTRKSVSWRESKAFDCMYIDVFMVTPRGLGGQKYGAIITDDATRARWASTFKHKSDAFKEIQTMNTFVETQFKRKNKRWRMDGGKEYGVNELSTMAKDLGQVLELTTPYNPEQDGVSESSIKVVMSRVRKVMIAQQIPLPLWPWIFKAMVLIINRTATTALDGRVPYTALMEDTDTDQEKRRRPSMDWLRVLGVKTYVLVPHERRVKSQKLAERAEVGILVGYEGEHIYQVYIPSRKGNWRNRIVRTSNCRFDENGLITTSKDYKGVEITAPGPRFWEEDNESGVLDSDSTGEAEVTDATDDEIDDTGRNKMDLPPVDEQIDFGEGSVDGGKGDLPAIEQQELDGHADEPLAEEQLAGDLADQEIEVQAGGAQDEQLAEEQLQDDEPDEGSWQSKAIS